MVGRIERLVALRLFLNLLITRKNLGRALRNSIPKFRQVWLALHGFFPENHVLYRFDRNDWRLYVNDLQTLRSSMINKKHRIIVDDKLVFEAVVGKYATVPESLVLVRNAQPVWFRSPGVENTTFPELVRQKQAVVAKPVSGKGGSGIQLLEFREGNFLRNNEVIDESSLRWSSLGARDTLISDYVQQGEFANSLYSKSVNTVRLLTMQDPDTKEPFVAGAIIRIGSDQSAPVDNVTAGGFFCNIESETGKLSKAFADWGGAGDDSWIDRHPDTGVIFENQVVPDWGGLCEQTVELASKLPMLPYIGWDLAILDGGFAVIEANSWSDVITLQMGQPLLADPRVRRFFEYHNVL